jgi:hypothetical protein
MIAFTGCGGGDGPTAPRSTPNSRILFVSYTFQNDEGMKTIQQARLLLDSKVVGSYQGEPASSVELGGAVFAVPAGDHTLSVVVDRQTQSPSRYHTGGPQSFVSYNIVVVQDDQGNPLGLIYLTNDVVSMQTGEPYRVSLKIQ